MDIFNGIIDTQSLDLTGAIYLATQYEEYGPADFVTEINPNAKLQLDGSGNLAIRGSILTDEGSFRDDFSDTLSTDWLFNTTGNGSTINLNSIQTVNSGTTTGTSGINIYTDYSPIVFKGLIQISQRIANQTISFGFRDNVDSPNINAEFQFTGTNNTQVTVFTQSSANSGNSETYTQTIPNTKTSAVYLEYEIQVLQNYVSFFIDGILIRSCKIHVPTTGPGSELYLFFNIDNATTVTNTALNIDYIDVANMNQVEVKTEINSKPLAVQQSGDQHHITSVFTANSVTADQTIINFTVPLNRTMYIIGLSIETNSIGGTVKIGKNTIGTPAAPGVNDSTLFRQFNMQNASNTLDSFRFIDYGSFPRIVGSNGDIFKVLVTPRGNQTTIWSCTIDYILK